MAVQSTADVVLAQEPSLFVYWHEEVVVAMTQFPLTSVAVQSTADVVLAQEPSLFVYWHASVELVVAVSTLAVEEELEAVVGTADVTIDVEVTAEVVMTAVVVFSAVVVAFVVVFAAEVVVTIKVFVNAVVGTLILLVALSPFHPARHLR